MIYSIHNPLIYLADCLQVNFIICKPDRIHTSVSLELILLFTDIYYFPFIITLVIMQSWINFKIIMLKESIQI